MTEITVRCCEGNERYHGECLRQHCPNYNKASAKRGDQGHIPNSIVVYSRVDHDRILQDVKSELQCELSEG